MFHAFNKSKLSEEAVKTSQKEFPWHDVVGTLEEKLEREIARILKVV
jgi:hypothetical protein